MFINQLHQGGIRALLTYDSTIFDEMQLPSGIDLQEVVDTIIFKYGDTPLFSPDPAVMKYYLKAWSLHRLPLWNRFKVAVEKEYDPIENYDRIEESDDDFTHGLTVENQISADNESDYQPDNKGINSGTDKRHISSRTHGNIGVTTSQQMLTSELDLIPLLDVVDYIADDFHSEFCLDIY